MTDKSLLWVYLDNFNYSPKNIKKKKKRPRTLTFTFSNKMLTQFLADIHYCHSILVEID